MEEEEGKERIKKKGTGEEKRRKKWKMSGLKEREWGNREMEEERGKERIRRKGTDEEQEKENGGRKRCTKENEGKR